MSTKAKVVVIILLVSSVAFSRYAYSVISTDQKVELQDNLERANEEITQLREKLNDTRNQYAKARRDRYNALLLMFPGEENQERIINLFEEENKEVAEEPIEDVEEEVSEESEEG